MLGVSELRRTVDRSIQGPFDCIVGHIIELYHIHSLSVVPTPERVSRFVSRVCPVSLRSKTFLLPVEGPISDYQLYSVAYINIGGLLWECL